MNLKHFVPGLFAVYGACNLVLHARASIRHLTLYRDTAYDNLLPVSATVTSSVPTKSKIQCAGLCRDEVSCNSFFYNDVSRKCLRQRVVYLAPPQVDALPEPGWQYFRLRSVCPAGKDYVADRLSSTCYRLELSLKYWTTARDDCAANGEMLVVLEPVVKAQFIKDFMNANRHLTHVGVYIGATQSASEILDFTWLDGHPLNITATTSFWKKIPQQLKPNGVILLKYSGKFSWLLSLSTWPIHSICERPFLQ